MKTKKKISKLFEDDHVKLDRLYDDFQKYKASDFPRARESFLQFKFGLIRHMMWEENILFPFFEQKNGTSFSQPVRIMRLEHRYIARLVEIIQNKLQDGDLNIRQEEGQLLSLLQNHNRKEERILYPSIDRLATFQDVDLLLTAIYNLPEERYELWPETA